MHSKYSTVQKLMDEIESLDPKNKNMEETLQIIAKKVAIEQRKIKAKAEGTAYDPSDEALIDPSEGLVCEGCQ